MSQNYLNNIFLNNDIDIPRELYSSISSESQLEGNIINTNDPFNFYDRNTFENTHDERNNNPNAVNKGEELIIDISRNDSNGKKPKGRKKNGEDSTNSNHNKYSDDNSRRKIKRIIISELQDYINERIAYKYGNDIGEGMIKKRLMKLCQNQISNASIGFNIDFLNKTLKDIFSEDVTGRITNYSSDRNKEVIQELINNKDLVKRDYFEGLFNLTFFDCLKYFRNDDIEPYKLQYLEGFTKFNEIKDKFYKKKDKNYINHISKYLNDYEKILFKKKPRKSKKGQKSEKIKISH